MQNPLKDTPAEPMIKRRRSVYTSWYILIKLFCGAQQTCCDVMAVCRKHMTSFFISLPGLFTSNIELQWLLQRRSQDVESSARHDDKLRRNSKPKKPTLIPPISSFLQLPRERNTRSVHASSVQPKIGRHIAIHRTVRLVENRVDRCNLSIEKSSFR